MPCGLEDIELEWFTNYIFRRAQIGNAAQTMFSLLWCSGRLSNGTITILDLFIDFPEILTNCEVIHLVDDIVIFASAKDGDSMEFILNEDLKFEILCISLKVMKMMKLTDVCKIKIAQKIKMLFE